MLWTKRLLLGGEGRIRRKSMEVLQDFHIFTEDPHLGDLAAWETSNLPIFMNKMLIIQDANPKLF